MVDNTKLYITDENTGELKELDLSAAGELQVKDDTVAPISNAFTISPSDDTDLVATTRGIYVGTSGTLKVDTAGGDTVTFVGVAAGLIFPVRATRVYADGTDAEDLVGVY